MRHACSQMVPIEWTTKNKYNLRLILYFYLKLYYKIMRDYIGAISYVKYYRTAHITLFFYFELNKEFIGFTRSIMLFFFFGIPFLTN